MSAKWQSSETVKGLKYAIYIFKVFYCTIY